MNRETMDQPMAQETPLFIPLQSADFAQFESGEKTDELRRYGPGWNEKTCPVGRAVVLSRGCGEHASLAGRISTFKRQRGTTFGSTYRAAIQNRYGNLDIWIACIGISDLSPIDLQSGLGETQASETDDEGWVFDQPPEDGQSVNFVVMGLGIQEHLDKTVLGGNYRIQGGMGLFCVPGAAFAAYCWKPAPTPPDL